VVALSVKVTRSFWSSRVHVPHCGEEFFFQVGVPVATRTEPPPGLDGAEQAAFIAKSQGLVPRYRTELLPPPAAQGRPSGVGQPDQAVGALDGVAGRNGQCYRREKVSKGWKSPSASAA
jgi:hypothetical protein